jgi:hypothetical protein
MHWGGERIWEDIRHLDQHILQLLDTSDAVSELEISERTFGIFVCVNVDLSKSILSRTPCVKGLLAPVDCPYLPEFEIVSVNISERVLLVIHNRFLEGADRLVGCDLNIDDAIRTIAVHNTVETEI